MPLRYAVVIEDAGSNFSGYLPDLPGFIATGATPDEVVAELQSGLEFHLAGLREEGEPIPQPSVRVDYVTVDPGQMPTTLPLAEGTTGTLPAWQTELLDERLAELERNPEAGVEWEEV